jgi:hypothetical protein
MTMYLLLWHRHLTRWQAVRMSAFLLMDHESHLWVTTLYQLHRLLMLQKYFSYFMVQNILWKLDGYAACQRIARFLYGTRKFIIVFTPRRFEIFRTMLLSYGEGLLAPRPTPRGKTTPCRLSATAYSIYSQLPSISEGLILYPQPEKALCRGDKGST